MFSLWATIYIPFIIATIICVWTQQFCSQSVSEGRCSLPEGITDSFFPRNPFWRPRPTGSWGNWLTGCAEFEPTLCWTVCARGFVGCPQWYDLLWEQKGLTFGFILTYPRVCVYSVSVFYYGNSFLHSVSILFLCYILSYTHLLPLS